MAFYQTVARLSHSVQKKQSKSWITRQYRDPYVQKRLRSPAAYRSRSAFKLLEIDSRYEFLKPMDVNVVVDLGAAPGGWSQVVAGKFGWVPSASKIHSPKNAAKEIESIPEDSETLWSDSALPLDKDTPDDVFDPLNIDDIDFDSAQMGRGTIIATDLQNIIPIHGVQTVKGNFLEESTVQIIRGLLFVANKEPKVDVILSDMAANITGNSVHDSQSSLEICEAVFEFAKRNLRTANEVGRPKGGVLLMKFFANPLLDQFREEKLQPNFLKTFCIKPPSSRSASSEAYFLCQGWKP